MRPFSTNRRASSESGAGDEAVEAPPSRRPSSQVRHGLCERVLVRKCGRDVCARWVLRACTLVCVRRCACVGVGLCAHVYVCAALALLARPLQSRRVSRDARTHASSEEGDSGDATPAVTNAPFQREAQALGGVASEGSTEDGSPALKAQGV